MKPKWILLLLLCLPGTLQARDVVTEGAGGGVNWTQGFIWAYGYGVASADAPERNKRLLARRAAQVDAYRNLAEFVNGVQVTSETVVMDLALQNDTVRTKLEGLVKGAIMVQDHYQNDIAQVTLRIYFDGPFSAIVNPEVRKAADDYSYRYFHDPLRDVVEFAAGLSRLFVSNAWGQQSQTALIRSREDLELAKRILEQAGDAPSSALLLQLQAEAAAWNERVTYTGLLVDARGVRNFQLATIPRLRDPDGQVVYPSNELLNSSLAARRPVSYDFDIDDAVRNSRISVSPYIVKALSIFKSRASDLVISNEDAEFIRANSQMMEAVNNAGVMIVVAE